MTLFGELPNSSGDFWGTLFAEIMVDGPEKISNDNVILEDAHHMNPKLGGGQGRTQDTVNISSIGSVVVSKLVESLYSTTYVCLSTKQECKHDLANIIVRYKQNAANISMFMILTVARYWP